MRHQRTALALAALLACGLAPRASAAPIDNDPEYKGRPLSAWLKDLDSRDADARVAALKAVAALGPAAAAATPALIEALGDRSAYVRRLAADALGAIGPDARAAAVPLARLATDPDDRLRWAAGEALGRLGPEAVNAALTDKDKRARRGAVRLLGDLGPDARSFAAALKKLLADPDAEVRAAAAAALLNVDAAAALPALTKDADRRLALALAAMAPVGPDGRPPTTDKDGRAALLAAARDKDDRIRLLALAALARLSPDDARSHVAELREALKGAKEEERVIAVAALCRLGPAAEDAVPELVDGLGAAAGSDVGLVAYVALGRVGKPAVKPLLKQLKGDSSSAVTAALVLSRMGKDGEGAVAELREQLRSADHYLAAASAYALARLSPKDRKAAEDALRKFEGDEGIVASFYLAWLRTDDPGKAAEAFGALLRTKPGGFIDLSELERLAGSYGLATLGKGAKPAVEDLREGMNYKEPVTAALSAYALAQASPDDAPKAVETLKALARREPDDDEKGLTESTLMGLERQFKEDDYARALASVALCDALLEQEPGDRFPASYALGWFRQGASLRPASDAYETWKRRRPFVRGLAEQALQLIDVKKDR
jgi:HEAT repeat protein